MPERNGVAACYSRLYCYHNIGSACLYTVLCYLRYDRRAPEAGNPSCLQTLSR